MYMRARLLLAANMLATLAYPHNTLAMHIYSGIRGIADIKLSPSASLAPFSPLALTVRHLPIASPSDQYRLQHVSTAAQTSEL